MALEAVRRQHAARALGAHIAVAVGGLAGGAEAAGTKAAAAGV